MPRGNKSAYTDKQKRMAEHIEDSYESRGVSDKESERRAWATVNKETGGGQKGHKGGSTGDKKGSSSSSSEHAKRSAAAKKGWETRRKHSR
jgi:plasmid stabilization system protein ParE